MEDHWAFRFGRLYLSYTHTNSPTYWKRKLMNFEAIASRRHRPSLMVSITLNCYSRENWADSAFIFKKEIHSPHLEKPTRFWSPVYNHCSIKSVFTWYYTGSFEQLKWILSQNIRQYRFNVVASARYATWSYCALLYDIDHINSINSSQMPPKSDPELRKLEQMFNIRRQPPNCPSRARNWRCRLKYDELNVHWWDTSPAQIGTKTTSSWTTWWKWNHLQHFPLSIIAGFTENHHKTI